MNKKLFFKYIRNYFSVLGISLLLLIPVYMDIYRGAEERVLNNAYSSLEKNVDDLDAHINKMSIMAEVLSSNEYVEKVAAIKGEPKSSDAFTMIKAKEFLQSYFLLRVEEFEEYLVFRNNDIMIEEENVLSDRFYQNYEGVGQNGTDFAAFRQQVFENKKSVVYISHVKDDKSSGIIGSVKVAEGVGTYADMALVFELDKELLNEILGVEENSTNFGYITDKNGEILYQVNCPQGSLQQVVDERQESAVGKGPADGQEIRWNGQTYTLFQVQAKSSGLYWKLGISNQIIQQEIANVNRIIVTYIIVAVLGICLICALCAWNSTRNMNGIMEEVGRLKKSMLDSMLAKLFLCGVYSTREKEELQNHLCWDMEFYCVVCISTRLKLESEILECFAHVDDFFAANFQYVAMNINENERSYIVQMEQTGVPDTSAVSEALKKLLAIQPEVLIGISSIGTGMENVQFCYRQARLMNRQAADLQEIAIKEYHEQIDTRDKIFKLNLGNRIYDLIYAAEKEALGSLFDKIRSYAGKSSWYTEAEMMQFFFEIQTPVARVWDEMEQTNKCGKEILSYQPDKTMIELVDALEEASLYLCDNVNRKRNDSSKKTCRYDMVQFVEEHYADKDMCVTYAASHMGLSDKYFATLFKAQTGKSFGLYVEARRMKQVEKYLLETDMSMAKIAENVGYNTLDAFYKSFRKVYGMAPGKWKEVNANKKNGLRAGF